MLHNAFRSDRDIPAGRASALARRSKDGEVELQLKVTVIGECVLGAGTSLVTFRTPDLGKIKIA